MSIAGNRPGGLNFPRRTWLAATAAWLLASCTVGPDFTRPDAPAADSYTQATMPAATVGTDIAHGGEQRFAMGGDLQQKWWTLFHSEALDRLIDRALRDSPNVASAQAALRQAQEALAAQRGSTWPSVNGQASVEREQNSGAAIGQPGNSVFTLYNASVNVSYALDLFGSLRRQLEALQAQVDSERFQVQATYMALTANLATTAIREASLRAQIQATGDIEKLQQTQLDIVERRFGMGAVTRSDVLAQRTALAQTRAGLPPLQRQLSLLRHQLALYSGQPPEVAGLPQFELDGFELPLQLPVSVPSELVRQRPDILSAEAVLHEASARVGVATAGLYPQLTLSGNVGSESLGTSQLFKSDSLVWGLGAGLAAPIFNGGQLQANRRAAVAAFDAAAASYRQTVLVAFSGVADALRALESDARALQAQADAHAQARAALELASRQFNVGAVSYLTLLNAQQQVQQTRIAVVQAQADRLADTVALFQALGGGWWNDNVAAPTPGSSASGTGRGS